MNQPDNDLLMALLDGRMKVGHLLTPEQTQLSESSSPPYPRHSAIQ